MRGATKGEREVRCGSQPSGSFLKPEHKIHLWPSISNWVESEIGLPTKPSHLPTEDLERPTRFDETTGEGLKRGKSRPGSPPPKGIRLVQGSPVKTKGPDKSQKQLRCSQHSVPHIDFNLLTVVHSRGVGFLYMLYFLGFRNAKRTIMLCKLINAVLIQSSSFHAFRFRPDGKIENGGGH